MISIHHRILLRHLRASVSSAGSEVILQDKNIQTLSVTWTHVPTVNIKYVTSFSVEAGGESETHP